MEGTNQYYKKLWTRNWEGSWLLRKDKYLLKYATEYERKKVYFADMLMIFSICTLPILMFMMIFHVVISTPIMFIIIATFLVFVVRFSFIFISLASIFLFIILPIKGIVSFNTVEYTKVLYLFPIVALFQGYFTLVYIFNNIYLKKFDNIYFDKIYTYLGGKQDYNLQKELLLSFKEKVSSNFILVGIFKYGVLNYFLDIFSNMFILGIRKGWAKYPNFAWYFGRKSFRLTFLYGWLFILKPELFDEAPSYLKPSKLITYSSLLVSLVSILFLIFLVASIVLGGVLVFLNKLV